MATSKSQRIAMWVIVIVMTVGTIGGYVAIIMQNDTTQTSTADLATQQAEQQKLMEDAARKSAAASQPLEGYAAEAFDAATATELQTATLKEGEGDAVVAATSKIKMNYFGWTPDGKIFDSTNKSGTVTPYAGQDNAGAEANSFVPGFTEGITGMKKGEVRKLVIPAAKGYGATGSAPLIAPDTPIAFVVEIVDIVQ